MKTILRKFIFTGHHRYLYMDIQWSVNEIAKIKPSTICIPNFLQHFTQQLQFSKFLCIFVLCHREDSVKLNITLT